MTQIESTDGKSIETRLTYANLDSVEFEALPNDLAHTAQFFAADGLAIVVSISIAVNFARAITRKLSLDLTQQLQ